MTPRPLLLLLMLPLAASAPAEQAQVPLQQSLAEARAEEAAANARTAKLEQAAAAAKNDAARFQQQQAAAAEALEAAEARITAADAQYRLAQAQAAAYRQRLAVEQRPAASLLAGLATMARRPPLLALADHGSVDDLVEVSILLDSTLPAIRARTRALSAELVRGRQLEAAALQARGELLQSRRLLADRQQRFAALQRQAIDRSVASGSLALSAGDQAIAAGEQVEQLQSEQSRRMSSAAVAAVLAGQAPAPPSPIAGNGRINAVPFAYRLPVSAPVVSGLGAVDDSGVRSRGIVFRTARGAPVIAPASGIVRYSGPFRDYDGLVIIDHGHGWLSVLVNVASTLKVGDRVEIGDAIGRALGPVQVQLSSRGQLLSPALIAGSSPSLSNNGKAS